MSNINESMDELREMMKQITLLDNPAMEENEVIIDNSSEDEPDKKLLHPLEEGSSGLKPEEKLKKEEKSKNEIEKIKNKKGYFKTIDDKYEKYEKYEKYKQFKPKEMRDDLLDLDCVQQQEGKARLHTWVAEHQIQLQLDESISKLNAESYLNLLIYRTTGMVFTFLASLKDTGKIPINTYKTHNDILIAIVETLNQQFLGGINLLGNIQTNEDEDQIMKVRHVLNNIEICDICYLNEFICQYESYYYQLPHEDYEKYMDIFIQKLPQPFNETISKKFKENETEGLVANSLGGIIKSLRDYIRNLCIQKQELKKSKRPFNLCCDKYEDIPQRFGCEPEKYKKRRKHKPKYYKSYNKKRFKYNNKYHKPQKKKWNDKYKNKKYCSQGKKNCKCWLCQEIGHYANECPKRKNYKKEIKYLNLANQIGLEPIESSYSEIEYCYKIITDSESSESSYNRSSDESE